MEMGDMKKAFTLVELLAVIVIIGVLVTISVPIVRSSLKGYRNQLLEKQEENILMAAKLWGSKNPTYLPTLNDSTKATLAEAKNGTKEEYGVLVLYYGDLLNENFIEKTKNPVTGEYFENQSYQIEITKQGESYNYTISPL